jgi:hypothetical protein
MARPAKGICYRVLSRAAVMRLGSTPERTHLDSQSHLLEQIMNEAPEKTKHDIFDLNTEGIDEGLNSTASPSTATIPMSKALTSSLPHDLHHGIGPTDHRTMIRIASHRRPITTRNSRERLLHL